MRLNRGKEKEVWGSVLTDRGTVGTPPPPPIAICVEERWVEYAMVLRNSPPLARSHSGMSGALIGNMVLLQRKTPYLLLTVSLCYHSGTGVKGD